jgi:hypothetical protein
MLELGWKLPACLFATLCVRCVAEPPSGLDPSGAARGELELQVIDARGEPADPDRLPRRPTLVLTHPDGIAAAEDAIALFRGPPDDALLDDLQRAPLAATQLARRIDCEIQPSGPELRLAPRAALAPDEPHALAIASWASTLRGDALVDEGSPIVFALRTDARPEAGARVLGSWPADGGSGVGTNLRAAVLTFDGEVSSASDGVWLEGPDGLAVPGRTHAAPCAQLAPEHTAHFCIQLVPERRLAPAALHRLVVGNEARDGHTAPVGPWHASFRTAQSRDLLAPVALASSCAVDEQAVELGCALADDASIVLRMQFDEPVIAWLELAGVRQGMSASDGRVRLRVAELAADAAHDLHVELHDAAGNTLARTFTVRTLPPLATLAISEVLADPLGAEPQQEFVELFNYGKSAIDLLGFSLGDRSDMPGAAIERSARVQPQARALLVADGYDPRAPGDAPPKPGALLVRVGRALGSAGLRNAGEALFLRDALGRRVSAAPDRPAPRPGVCTVRASAEMRSGEPDAFVYAAEQGCTPGE